MTTFRVLDDLPEPEPVRQADTRERPTKAILRTAIANPERWIEVSRIPLRNPGGTIATGIYTSGKRLEQYGLHTQLRREGDERVLYVRLVPGSPA